MEILNKLFPITLLLPVISLAETTDDLFSLSLQELGQVKVTTASKKSESILQAPSIISVISQSDIKSYGARNIKDVLLRIPNFYMFDSNSFTASGVTMRAGATQHLNNHVLYLINGRPLRESQNGGLHTDINLLFPIEAIERIEVIRGPGSVLYGSNAFNGTINFITKQVDQQSAQFSAGYGSDQYTTAYTNIATTFAKSGSISLHANYLDSDGETVSAYDEVGNKGSLDLSREGHNLYLDTQYNGFRLNALVNEITTPTLSGPYSWENKAEFELKRTFYDLEYSHSFNQNWVAKLNYTSNKSERLVNGPGNSSAEFEANGYLYEVNITGQLNNTLNLLTGATKETLKGNLNNAGGRYENDKMDYYAQLDFQLHANTKLSLGAQYNDPDGAASNTSPRLALLHQFNESWSSKFLYSEAFRSPYGSELFFDAVFLQGDNKLKPESIETLEAQLTYTEKAYFVSSTVYYSEATDAISRAFIDGTNTFINTDNDIESYGFELESQWSINDFWSLQGSYSYQTNEDSNHQKDFMPAPRTMVKMGINYHSRLGYDIGLWNSYFGSTSKTENIEGNNVSVVNPSAGDFNLLSLNINSNLGKLFDRASLKKVSASLFANNLLDEETYYPELGRRSVNTYPQSHGRAVYLKVTVKL